MVTRVSGEATVIERTRVQEEQRNHQVGMRKPSLASCRVCILDFCERLENQPSVLQFKGRCMDSGLP